MSAEPHGNNPNVHRRLMKVPALNVSHVCGTVLTTPAAVLSAGRPAGAIFELSARTYERGRKTVSVRLKVVCWAGIAETVLTHVRETDIVLITGSLQNDPSNHGSLGLVASTVQFLTHRDEASPKTE